MSDVHPKSQSLKAGYETKVAADLQQNTEDHERVTAQISALQEQLEVLQLDREMLLSMQQAVGAKNGKSSTGASATAKKAAKAVKAEPAVRGAAGAKTPRAQRAKTAKKAAPSRADKSAGTGDEAGAPAESKAPSLVELVRGCLVRQGQPMSATEVTAALSTPERQITANSVRTALEGLVRKAAAHRSKQGHSVYYQYVTGGTAGPESAGEAEPESASE